MAKSEPTPGLLSKVARFVRNPTKSWAELEQQEPEPDNGYSKEALKEMIERKRQNDFVRKREFDYLRKLRRREPRLGSDQLGRPSFFQSSLPSNFDERAETLKKIDEIEAQMSRQWWTGKQAESPARTSALPGAPKAVPSMSPETTASVSFLRTESGSDPSGPAIELDSHWLDSPAEFEPTEMSPSAAISAGMPQASRQPPQAGSGPQAAAAVGAAGAGFMGAVFASDRLFAVEPADSLTDPDLEDAAIRFANGDDAGAEAGLLHALQGENLRPELAQAWMAALFDLYRTTGQQARFDAVALDFAKRLGRSAPAWFSTPELLAPGAVGPAVAAGMPPAAADQPLWSCPAELTAAALAALDARLQDHPSPWQLDWRALVSMAPDALDPFQRLLSRWCATPVHLVFRGHDQLDKMLRALTPGGNKGVDPRCWQLRLDALRVMGRHDEFEQVAIEYCIVFEVSPPSWQQARCSCELDGAAGRGDPAPAVATPSAGPAAPARQAELVGEIRGDAADLLQELGSGPDGADRLVVSCARLIRVDFAAAGSILTWVARQKERGCQVQFRDVSRIVAAFFKVIGISEYAQVVPRST